MRKLILLAAAMALAPAVAAAAEVGGAWKLNVEVGGQAVPVACTFVQADKAFTGTCNRSDQPDAPAKAAGTVDGSAVKFAYDVDFQGQALNIAYTGTLSSDTAMNGTLEVAGVSGTFTGAKQ